MAASQQPGFGLTDVLFQVDTLHQMVHTGLQFSRQGSRFLDGIFSSLIADLRNRERLGIPSSLPPADPDGLDPVALLSSAKESVTTAASSRTAGGAHHVPTRWPCFVRWLPRMQSRRARRLSLLQRRSRRCRLCRPRR
jgi:hypothetical protein